MYNQSMSILSNKRIILGVTGSAADLASKLAQAELMGTFSK